MADTGGFFGALGEQLGFGGPTALQQLQNNGYSQYQMTQAPDVSGKFGGYGAANANTAANAPYMQAQQGLLGQLQAQANGTGGPTVADQQMQQGIGASLAAQRAAAAGARGQNAGLASAQLGSQLAGTTAGAAGQAGAQRAQEQQAAQGALGGLTQGAIGQGNQLAEANQQAQNQSREFNAGLQSQLGNLQNQNWQYGNNLMAQQQAQQNALVGQQTNGAVAQDQAMAGSAIGQMLPNMQNVGQAAGMMAGAADGLVAGMAGGGVVIPSQASNEFRAPGAMSPMGGNAPASSGGGLNPMALAGMFKGKGGNGADFSLNPSNPDQALSPGDLQSPEAITPGIENMTLQDPSQFAQAKPMGGADALGLGPLSMADGGFTAPPPSQYNLTGPGGGIGGGTGYDPTARMGGSRNMADGGIAAPVANGPTKAVIGENGPEAVVPIKPNGDVDPARARNPGLQALLENHPALRHIQPSGAPAGQPAGTGDRAVAAALAQAGAHLSDRVANLEATISHLAKRNQRRTA